MLRPSRVRSLLVGCIATLCVLHVVFAVAFVRWGMDAPALTLLSLFDLDREAGFGTAVSASVLAFAALLLAWVARSDPPRRRGWRSMEVVVALLAAEEVVGVHDALSPRIQEALDTGGPLFFAWVVPAMALVVLVAAVLGRFVLHLPRRTRRYVLVAAVLYVGGAIGVEMLGASETAAGRRGRHGVYQGAVLMEETLELVGGGVLVLGLLHHLAAIGAAIEVSVEEDQPATDATTSATEATSLGARS